jgi:hypothetical protein
MARKKLPPPEADSPYEHKVIPPPAEQVVGVPAEMVLQLATGMEDEVVVAGRFGFDEARYKKLKEWLPFVQAVEARRVELQNSGVTFRIQAAFMAEDLAKDVYRIAKTNDATFLQKLEAFRTFTELADLKPKANAATSTGPAFSISIVLSPQETKHVAGPDAIDGTSTRVAPGGPEGAQLVNGVLVRPGGG